MPRLVSITTSIVWIWINNCHIFHRGGVVMAAWLTKLTIFLLCSHLMKLVLDKLAKYVTGSPDGMPSLRLYEGDLQVLMTILQSLNSVVVCKLLCYFNRYDNGPKWHKMMHKNFHRFSKCTSASGAHTLITMQCSICTFGKCTICRITPITSVIRLFPSAQLYQLFCDCSIFSWMSANVPSHVATVHLDAQTFWV